MVFYSRLLGSNILINITITFFRYCIPPRFMRRFERLADGLFPQLKKECPAFLRHKVCKQGRFDFGAVCRLVRDVPVIQAHFTDKLYLYDKTNQRAFYLT